MNYTELIGRAQALGNGQELSEELRSAGPPPYASGAGFRMQWKWSTIFEGADKFLAGNIGRTLVAPGGSVQDLNNDANGMVLSADKLVPQTRNLGPKELGLEFSVPIFFIQGELDFTSATSLAREYMAALHAPAKIHSDPRRRPLRRFYPFERVPGELIEGHPSSLGRLEVHYTVGHIERYLIAMPNRAAD